MLIPVSLVAETATVLEYLARQNRPYNLVDIFMNLQQKVGKAVCMVTVSMLAHAQRRSKRH